MSFRRIFEFEYKYYNFHNNNKKQRKEKKTLISETDEKKAVKKKIKTIKTLKKYFVNFSIIIFRNKEMTKKFITKINRNSKNVKNEEKL